MRESLHSRVSLKHLPGFRTPICFHRRHKTPRTMRALIGRHYSALYTPLYSPILLSSLSTLKEELFEKYQLLSDEHPASDGSYNSATMLRLRSNDLLFFLNSNLSACNLWCKELSLSSLCGIKFVKYKPCVQEENPRKPVPRKLSPKGNLNLKTSFRNKDRNDLLGRYEAFILRRFILWTIELGEEIEF